MRINKYISTCGVCSRREADELIKCGKVMVNGNVVNELGMQIQDTDAVVVNGKKISTKESKVYIMLNKPQGYVTTSKEQFNRPCVMDLIHEDVRVFPVGRLDMYSQGLLLLTNDGQFMNNIIHPKTHVAKTYEVITNKAITNDQIKLLENGVNIDGYITQKAIVSNVRDNFFEITIFEGKNRQIRKMCIAVDLKVVALKRIRIGNLELGNLKSGKYRYLTSEDLNKITKTSIDK